MVEYSILEPQVSIGRNCIVSNVHLPNGLSVPEDSFLHTIPLSRDEQTVFTTFAFGESIFIFLEGKIESTCCLDIGDSMKASVPRERVGELKYCGIHLVKSHCDFSKYMQTNQIIDHRMKL